MCQNVQPLFFTFLEKGHGGKVRDDGVDEEDGYDETLIPLDYGTEGQIRDDDLLKNLVIPMARGVFVTSIMDCCHSGTVLDLPFNFKADGEQSEMTGNEDFDFGNFDAGDAVALAAIASECCKII